MIPAGIPEQDDLICRFFSGGDLRELSQSMSELTNGEEDPLSLPPFLPVRQYPGLMYGGEVVANGTRDSRMSGYHQAQSACPLATS